MVTKLKRQTRESHKQDMLEYPSIGYCFIIEVIKEFSLLFICYTLSPSKPHFILLLKLISNIFSLLVVRYYYKYYYLYTG